MAVLPSAMLGLSLDSMGNPDMLCSQHSQWGWPHLPASCKSGVTIKLAPPTELGEKQSVLLQAIQPTAVGIMS